MARAGWAAAIAAALMATAAFAQDSGDYLNAQEVRAAILGRELSGMTEVSATPWRECIERSGATIYRYGAQAPLEGSVRVTDDGLACFHYPESGAGEACWFMRREGERYVFDDADGMSESFIVMSRPRVAGCGENAPVA